MSQKVLFPFLLIAWRVDMADFAGIFYVATLRLAPVVPNKVAMAQFPDVEHAVSAVQEILNTPHGPHIRQYFL